jgi:hypothetical protein
VAPWHTSVPRLELTRTGINFPYADVLANVALTVRDQVWLVRRAALVQAVSVNRPASALLA